MAKELTASGYTVQDACLVMKISRSGFYMRFKESGGRKKGPKEADETHLRHITAIKAAHPFWGYRRCWAHLKYRENFSVGKKTVYRLMKYHELLAHQTIHKAKRKSEARKPRATQPRQFWGIDMTKFIIPSVGYAYLVIVLDWFTKEIVGWSLALRSRTEEWRDALEEAVQKEFPQGVKDQGLKLISDNGTQPTSTSFMKTMSTLSIKQIFTSYDNPKGNAETERMMRTLKEEVVWLNEFESLEEAKEKIGNFIENEYNTRYVHSALGYLSPQEFKDKYFQETFGKSA